MPTQQFLVNLKGRNLPQSIGNKAVQLRRLQDHGVRIPATMVCTWEAYQRYMENDVGLVAELRAELSRQLKPAQAYAVRSSANIEDSLERSFAGQFKSVLNVRGADPVLEAIWSIWATASSPAVQTYWQRKGGAACPLEMAVIIQEMVEPLAAGVALSRNPVNGADEIVVEAVQGRGDALVQSGLTPHRWIFKENHWTERPANGELPLDLAEKIVHGTRAIARQFKANVDLEWAWNGRELYWLQMREITSLNRPKIYSNHMAKEMLPGMIKPLVWSVNIPLKSAVFVQFLDEMLGKTGVQAEELIHSFYYRVYFNIGVLSEVFEKVGLPGDSVDMMTGLKPMSARLKIMPNMLMLRRLPRMVAFAHDKWMFHHKMRLAMPDLEKRVNSIRWQEAGQWSDSELLEAIDRLVPVVQEVAYDNILCPILSVMHTRMLENELKRAGLALEQVEGSENQPELEDYDPQVWLCRLHEAFLDLDAPLQEQVRSCSYEQLGQLPGANDFQQKTAKFIERFGYLSDNGNDFSCQPWRENPDFVLRLILDFSGVHQEKIRKIRLADVKINPLRRPMLGMFFERVRQYRLLREQLSRLYTYTYGLFRCYYLECGRRLAKTGTLDGAEDVFYLNDAEVRLLLAGQGEPRDARDQIARHKAEMEKFRSVNPPGLVYGDEEPMLEDQPLGKLSGIATSMGRYTGPVKITRGIQDFSKVEPGDVLVIPYSDVGWSPLFARVGAVIAESGGLLSHSSIIAREYGLPAVVSVNGAMNLCDCTRVTVDGYSGEIIIHTNGSTC
jgi:phosphohistidine swiveling domain-containing protein